MHVINVTSIQRSESQYPKVRLIKVRLIKEYIGCVNGEIAAIGGQSGGRRGADGVVDLLSG